jgi:hypothetical protein
MRQIIMQVNMQPAVVRTHREDQALVAQTPTLHGERMCAEARLHRFDRQTGSSMLTEEASSEHSLNAPVFCCDF